jgi:hypothetical protein
MGRRLPSNALVGQNKDRDQVLQYDKRSEARRKSRVRVLLRGFLAFSFVYPAQALLNSTTQFLARDRRAVAQGTQLGPGDFRVAARSKIQHCNFLPQRLRQS